MIRPRHQDQRIVRDLRDVTELVRLELDVGIGERRQDQLVGRALEDHAAVVGRVEQLLRGETAAGAAEVLDEDVLAEHLAEYRHDLARDGIRDAAGRVRHHQRHGLALADLGLRARCDDHSNVQRSAL